MPRSLLWILGLGLCLLPVGATVQVRPDGRDLAMKLDQRIVRHFSCEGVPVAQAFARWKALVDDEAGGTTVNLIVSEAGEQGKGSVTLEVRGLTAYHILTLLAARTGSQVEFIRNTVHVRIP